MAITVKLKYLRIAPRKVRQVSDLIRGKSAEEAQSVLNFTVKKAVQPLSKLLKSAVASARNDFQLQEANLFISKVSVDEGPKLKRWRARARGRAVEIQKKTSHITIVLDEIKKDTSSVGTAEVQETIKKSFKKRSRLKVVKEKKVIPPLAKEEKEKTKEPVKQERPKFRHETEVKKQKPTKGIRRMFRRKAF
ncbi:50S ribosomal protein L22 [Patescibacteria group bacterium]|nr:50S ribosomal protein L22 [Patescibacteria group bacterium]